MFPEVPSSSHQASQSRTLTNSASVNESNLAPSTWHFCLFSTSINLSCFLNAVNSSARCLSKERTCAGRSEQVIFEVSVVMSEKRIEQCWNMAPRGWPGRSAARGLFREGGGEGGGSTISTNSPAKQVCRSPSSHYFPQPWFHLSPWPTQP